MPIVRPATLEDCAFIAPRLRQADLTEMEALDGGDPYEGIVESFRASPIANVMEHNGEPFAIYGGAPDDLCSDSTVGISWLLGTDALKDHSVWFIRNCRDLLDEVHEHFPTLHNYADVRNTVHIRWLRWSGFTMGELVPRNGTHFVHHWRTKNVHRGSSRNRLYRR